MSSPPIRHPQVTDWHLAGEAVVYIRQSTDEQRRNNIGSEKFQRAQIEYLKALGFTRIRVVDEDQGKSGTLTADPRGRGGDDDGTP